MATANMHIFVTCQWGSTQLKAFPKRGGGGGLKAGRVRNEWPSFTLPKPHLNVFRFKLSNSYKIEGCYSSSGERRS